ncbi:hypothetical protein GCK72_000759 [Caenorhabditis remanei]|uniref:Uncharacterized protein n=1 Tax=Caenorhabditis remanei TaxID=31234 RepID=A0A6A5HQJ8_CAERE|nr:hypothetical protein GCK72_000759 [Caenorhabditis remanei]KAF1768946.1 hypothetical protein GCK72_000759 [Caenorhabditis remanei]
MTEVNDEDYPEELDLSHTTEENEGIVGSVPSDEMHFIGAPPGSDSEVDDEYLQYQRDPYSDYSSSDNEFDCDDYLKKMSREMPDLTNDLIVSGSDNTRLQELQDLGDPVEFLKVFLTASMMGQPLKVKDGFDPEDLDKCCSELMGITLTGVASVLLGAELQNIPNRSKTEMAFALANRGWLRAVNSKFYPVIPETENDFVLSLIEGAERLQHLDENKKREAEHYPSAEKEVNALISFNMIVELMNAVREEYRIMLLPYQTLSNGYLDMVTGKKYPEIHKKYFNKLNLDETKVWNSEWFNAFTGRSTLKKFVQMARFAEIVVVENPTSQFCFRADSENRPVRMFTANDIKDVEEKWSSGNEKNKNFGRNYGGQGQRGLPRGASQQPKRKIEQDPNYRSSTFAGGINDDDDDGSLMPSTSARENQAGPSSSTQPEYGRRSPSPTARNQRARSPSQESRNSNTVPQSSYRPIDPFAGAMVQPISAGVNGNRNAQGGYETRRLQTFGASSSESDEVSEGCYSDDDPEDQKRKTIERNEKRLRKEAREMERRKKHKAEVHVPPVTRFQTNPFYKHKSARAPEPSNPRASTAVEQEEREESVVAPRQSPFDAPSALAPAPATAPAAPSPVPQPLNADAQVNAEEVFLPPPPATVAANTLPLIVSSSTHDQDRCPAQMPYKPAEGVLERNKQEEADRLRREQLSEMRMRSGFNQVPASHPWMSASSNPGPSQPQAYEEPAPTKGFGNILPPTVQRSVPQPPPQQAPQMQQQQQEPIYSTPFVETYQGRNRQGMAPQNYAQPAPQNHAQPAPQNHAQPAPQNYAQSAPSQQQYPQHQNLVQQNPPLFPDHSASQPQYQPMQQQYQQPLPQNPYPIGSQSSSTLPQQQPYQHQNQDSYRPTSRISNHANPQHMDNQYSSMRDAMRPPVPRNDMNYDSIPSNSLHQIPPMNQPQYSSQQRQYNDVYPPVNPYNNRVPSTDFNDRRNRNEQWHQVQPGSYDPYGRSQNPGPGSSYYPRGEENCASFFGRLRKAAAASGGGESEEVKQIKIEIQRIVFDYASENRELTLSELKANLVRKMRHLQFFDVHEFIQTYLRNQVVIVNNGPYGPVVRPT